MLRGLFVGCLTSQQHASVSQGRICSDIFTCCHTEIEGGEGGGGGGEEEEEEEGGGGGKKKKKEITLLTGQDRYTPQQHVTPVEIEKDTRYGDTIASK